jgi:hypothetical protein
VNSVRVTRCGDTTFVLGRLFDPNGLVDTRTTANPAEIAAHQFDRLALIGASNDDVANVHRVPQAPTDQC